MNSLRHSPTLSWANVFPLRSPEWADIRVAVNAVKLPATQAPTWVSYKGSSILAFSDQTVESNEERVYFSIQIPHSYKEGTDLHFHVHWAGEDNTAGDVVWKLTHSWANMLAAFPAESPLTGVGANSTTVDLHNYTDMDDATGTGKEVSSMLLCSLRRNSNNVLDTYTGKDAYLLEFDVHFEMDTLGSATETAK